MPHITVVNYPIKKCRVFRFIIIIIFFGKWKSVHKVKKHSALPPQSHSRPIAAIVLFGFLVVFIMVLVLPSGRLSSPLDV